MKKSDKKTFSRGFRSAFDLYGNSLTKRHSSEDNLHASWYNVGVFLTRGMHRINEKEKIKPEEKFRKLSTF